MRTCETCSTASPRVFHHHWTCLVPECPMFWKQTEGPCAGHFIVSDLSYHSQFLQLPPSTPLPFGFQDVVKSLLKRNHTVPGTLRNYHFTRGFHCSKCGRLSSRYVFRSSVWTAEVLLLTMFQIAMGEMGMCKLPCTYVCSVYIRRRDTDRFTEHVADRHASSPCKGRMESNVADAFSRLFTQSTIK